ncbi:ribonuclease H2, subunit B [Protomyces lactucae-debilis]|uniref:Ribonuclease H2, subunit B n=1 Tax=Protomyces lactucae-debilis TaxID=2754530 RepID=A0A1Y2FGW3_PROLT|nr:ribonuclease H2, subunit B [Protomyces lactucae-debilis]ORY83188.1 ribonuclease H2, subunit B [Protomyces lactucae-debilis]
MSSAILICPGNAKDIIQLPHPKTRELCHFLRTPQPSACLYEVITFEQTAAKQTLFLPDRILAPAPIHVASPIDIAFFLISALEQDATKHNGRFVDAEDLLESLHTRIRDSAENHLQHLCDATTTPGFFRPSARKVQEWVAQRVEAVAAALPGSMVDSLVTWPASHEEASQLATEARQRAAWGLVASYLPDTVEQRIAPSFGVPALVAFEASRRATVINPNEFMKRSVVGDEAGLMAGVAKKQKKGSMGVEALKKVNTKGMKSMTSFFAKKTRPP